LDIHDQILVMLSTLFLSSHAWNIFHLLFLSYPALFLRTIKTLPNNLFTLSYQILVFKQKISGIPRNHGQEPENLFAQDINNTSASIDPYSLTGFNLRSTL
jgi:hypothetical protein